VLGILTGASVWRNEATEWIASGPAVSIATADTRLLPRSSPLGCLRFGLVREREGWWIRSLPRRCAAGAGQADLAAAPRRALLVTCRSPIVCYYGMPLMAIFQPFLPGFPVAVPLLGYWFLLGILFWRGAANLGGHVKAVSQSSSST